MFVLDLTLRFGTKDGVRLRFTAPIPWPKTPSRKYEEALGRSHVAGQNMRSPIWPLHLGYLPLVGPALPSNLALSERRAQKHLKGPNTLKCYRTTIGLGAGLGVAIVDVLTQGGGILVPKGVSQSIVKWWDFRGVLRALLGSAIRTLERSRG